MLAGHAHDDSRARHQLHELGHAHGRRAEHLHLEPQVRVELGEARQALVDLLLVAHPARLVARGVALTQPHDEVASRRCDQLVRLVVRLCGQREHRQVGAQANTVQFPMPPLSLHRKCKPNLEGYPQLVL
jgi:hypothetical protein